MVRLKSTAQQKVWAAFQRVTPRLLTLKALVTKQNSQFKDRKMLRMAMKLF